VSTDDIFHLIPELSDVFKRGDNVMEAAADAIGTGVNRPDVIDFAYDLQAGSYTALAVANPQLLEERAALRANLILPLLGDISSPPTILDAGSGESTMLVALAKHLAQLDPRFYGIDLSFSRVRVGRQWAENHLPLLQEPRLAVADMASIPLATNAVDLVYTNSALEPNSGREGELISELVRVSRDWIVLFEPLYELADPVMRAWMDRHKFVRNLISTTSKYATVVHYGLLDEGHLYPRPRGFIVARKADNGSTRPRHPVPAWTDPVSQGPLVEVAGGLFSSDLGVAYPVLDQVPILKRQFGIFAQALR